MRRVGRDRALAASCAAVFFGLLLCHSLLAPAFRPPDEPLHLDLVREWSADQDYELIGRDLSRQVTASLREVRFAERSRNLEQQAAPPRSERPRFDELGPDESSGQYNQISAHPPLYYVVYGTVISAIDVVEPGPRWAFDRELGILRLLTIAALTPVPYVIYVVTRRLGAGEAGAFVAALVPSTIPQLTHIGASVNNDNLLVALTAPLLWLIARIVKGDTRRSVALATGLSTGLLLFTKGFALFAPLVVAGAYALLLARHRVSWRVAAERTALAGAVALLTGGWWYIRNVIVYGTVQPAAESRLDPAPAGFDPDVGRWFATFRRDVPHRFFGDFGWFDVQLDRGWINVGLVVLGVGVVAALARRWRGVPMTRPVAVLLLVPFAFVLAFLLVQSYVAYENTAQFPGMQGRYFFTAVPFLAVVVGFGWERLAGPARRVLPAVAVLYAAAFQLAGARTMLSFYWGPPDGSTRDQIAAMLTWSPWPRAVSLAFGLVLVVGATAVAAGALLVLLRPAAPAHTQGTGAGDDLSDDATDDAGTLPHGEVAGHLA